MTGYAYTVQFICPLQNSRRKFTQEYNPCHLKLVKSVEQVNFYALTTADAGRETWVQYFIHRCSKVGMGALVGAGLTAWAVKTIIDWFSAEDNEDKDKKKNTR